MRRFKMFLDIFTANEKKMMVFGVIFVLLVSLQFDMLFAFALVVNNSNAFISLLLYSIFSVLLLSPLFVLYWVLFSGILDEEDEVVMGDVK